MCQDGKARQPPHLQMSPPLISQITLWYAPHFLATVTASPLLMPVA